MAPKTIPSSQSQSKLKSKPASRPRTVRLDSEGPPASSSSNGAGGSSGGMKMSRLDPLTAFSQQFNLKSQVPNGTLNSDLKRESSSPGVSSTASNSGLSGQSQGPSQSLSQGQSLSLSLGPNLKGKGKGKAKEPQTPAGDIDDALWVDKYEPTTEAELAVHVRKVDDVRRWLSEAFDGGPSGKLTKYRRILALTGPAGTGKTATLRVLAKEMGFEILEWRNGIAETPSLAASSVFGVDRDDFDFAPTSEDYGYGYTNQAGFDADYEGLFTKFEAFLTRASTCQSVFSTSSASSSTSTQKHNIPSSTQSSSTQSTSTQTRRHPSTQKPTSTQNPPTKTQTRKPSSTANPLPTRRLILLEDLPNILHPPTQTKFHDALAALVASPPATPPVPLVVVVSDAGVRGEGGDGLGDGWGSGGGGGTGWGGGGGSGGGGGTGGTGRWGKERVVDVRTVLPRELREGAYVTEIGFNPIAPTLMRKALQNLLTAHFDSSSSHSVPPPKEVLDIIVDSSNGDIRSAIMALQFACVAGASSSSSLSLSTSKTGTTKKTNGTGKKTKKGAGKGGEVGAGAGLVVQMQGITRREQSLALFHLLGKVLYNKRKGDAPSASTSAKDAQKEREADALLPDPPRLPEFLSGHERRTSRVDVDALYADSPIDSSLFGLYIHQNYTQFCSEVEQCDGVAEWLSWVDSSGGEKWYHTNPHQFHLLTLGTLHSLPSPVPRKGQKVFKPDFFGFLQKEKEAWEGVRGVRRWVVDAAAGAGSQEEDSSCRVGAYSNSEVILELGGLLKAYDVSHSLPLKHKPPPIHRLFSRMEFTRSNSTSGKQLDEKGDGPDGDEGAGEGEEGEEGGGGGVCSPDGEEGAGGREGESKGGWLESDDIDEF